MWLCFVTHAYRPCHCFTSTTPYHSAFLSLGETSHCGSVVVDPTCSLILLPEVGVLR